MNNDHKIVTFTSSTISCSSAGCPACTADQSALFKWETRISPPPRPLPKIRVHLAAALLLVSQWRIFQMRCLAPCGRQRAGGREKKSLPAFVVGLWCNLGVVGVFFCFFSRPLGHALCISEEKDPPHPSCACVRARPRVCAALHSPLSLLFDSNGHIRRPAPW